MSDDLVLITVESWRYDHWEWLPKPEEFEVYRGITVGHYTRPALAGLLTGRYRDAARAHPEVPTLAGRLREAGYTTIGVSYSPQTARGMGFEAGFDTYEVIEPDGSAVGRGSNLRERLAAFGPVRAIHRRLKPKGATLDALPTDAEALSTALRHFENADTPRFLWVHLMDTHRPYGRGSDALPGWLDAKAAAAGPRRFQRSISPGEQDKVVSAYQTALRRTSERLAAFLRSLGDEPTVVICGDHGEEFGEAGYYYHGGYRRRLVDTIVEVPLAVRGPTLVGDRVGLIDVAPTLTALGGGCANGTDGVNRTVYPSPGALTVAPWAGRVAVRWTGSYGGLQLASGGLATVEEMATGVSVDVEEQLRALGYVV